MRYYRITAYEGEGVMWNGFSEEQANERMAELQGACFSTLEEYEVPDEVLADCKNKLLTADAYVNHTRPKPLNERSWSVKLKRLVNSKK